MLPCRSTVTTTLSSGRPRFLRAVAAIILHSPDAESTSPPARFGILASASTSTAELSSTPTASLNTAWPSIRQERLAADRPHRHGVPRAHRIPAWEPSARNAPPACRASPAASSTTAPAPSPNSTQVVRSFQSMMRENTSAPITSARRCLAETIIASATASAVDEAAADCLHVEGSAAGNSEPGLDQAGALGKI